MPGAMAHEAATCETLLESQAGLTDVREVKPTPVNALTTVCVVETGNPSLVAMISQVALPTSAQHMASMRTPGLPSKLSIEMILFFLMVLVTRAASLTAPTNSVMTERMPAWGIVSVRAATDDAHELAILLAPLPNELRTKAIVIMPRIQSYLVVAAGAMTTVEAVVGEVDG